MSNLVTATHERSSSNSPFCQQYGCLREEKTRHTKVNRHVELYVGNTNTGHIWFYVTLREALNRSTSLYQTQVAPPTRISAGSNIFHFDTITIDSSTSPRARLYLTKLTHIHTSVERERLGYRSVHGVTGKRGHRSTTAMTCAIAIAPPPPSPLNCVSTTV